MLFDDGDSTPSEPTKICSACKRLLPWSDYTIQKPVNRPVAKCKRCSAEHAAKNRAMARAEMPGKEKIDPASPKACSKCGAVKQPEGFHFKNKESGRRMSWCKDCHHAMNRANEAKHPGRMAEYVRTRRRANPQPNRDAVKAYRLNNLEKVKAREKARRQTPEWKAKYAAYVEANREQIRRRRAQWKAANLPAIHAKDAAYREANRETIRKRHRAWIEANPHAFAVICARAKHRRRARESTVECTLTAQEWAEILRIQKRRCARCGRKFTPFLRPHKDHIVPLSKGGGLTFLNVQGLCGKCNNEKFVDDTDYRGLLPGLL